MTDDKSERNKAYYEANKDRILRRAKERQADPEYNARRRANRAMKSKRLGTMANKDASKRPSRQVVVLKSGQPVETEMYPLSLAAAKIGVSTPRIFAWIKAGLIPEPQFKHAKKGWSMYTSAEVEIMARVYRKHMIEGGLQFTGSDLFRDEVETRFMLLDNGIDTKHSLEN